MKLLENSPLSHFTTLRVGGPARYLLIPESKDELIEALLGLNNSGIPYAVIGNGSNLLVHDNGFKGTIILNTVACTDLRAVPLITAGSSVTLQQFVRFCIKNNKHAMEYLYSVPGTLGGAIFMNAGRGKIHKDSVSDYLASVEIFDGFQCRILTRKECRFKYRWSIFHRYPNWVILSASFDLPFQPRHAGEEKIIERIRLTKKIHDLQYPNAGSVFKTGFYPLKELNGLRIGDAKFSEKTSNWICNMGKATSQDITRLINQARKCHLKHGHFFPELEWIDLDRYYPRRRPSDLFKFIRSRFHLAST
ncbi:MAG: FAD-binding protein [Candidatus Omnitrophota bacterium]